MTRRGFTILELILIIMVVGIALPPVIMVFAESIKGQGRSNNISIASQLAHSLTEEIRTRRWDENSPSGGGVTASPSFPLGPESGWGEGQRRSYDDIDDYHGMSNTPPQDALGNDLPEYEGFTRSVSVVYVEESGRVFSVSASPTDHKLITVTVSCNAGTIDVAAIVSNRY